MKELCYIEWNNCWTKTPTRWTTTLVQDRKIVVNVYQHHPHALVGARLVDSKSYNERNRTTRTKRVAPTTSIGDIPGMQVTIPHPYALELQFGSRSHAYNGPHPPPPRLTILLCGLTIQCHRFILVFCWATVQLSPCDVPPLAAMKVEQLVSKALHCPRVFKTLGSLQCLYQQRGGDVVC